MIDSHENFIRERIKSLLLNDGKTVPQRMTAGFLKRSGVKNEIDRMFDDSYTDRDKLYCILNDLSEKPTCKTCGKTLSMQHEFKYGTFCSRSCSNHDPEVVDKIKREVSISMRNAYKDRGDVIKRKRLSSLRIHYGEDVSSPFCLASVREKAKDVLMERYGVDNVLKLEDFRGDQHSLINNRMISFNRPYGYDVEYLSTNLVKIKNLCKVHGDVEMSCTDFYNRAHKDRKGIVCTLCNPPSSFSSLELEFDEMLKSLNLSNYVRNTKKIIHPYELDFYFPNIQVAFELNGTYWHSEMHKQPSYHYDKSNLCLNKNIRLYHVWEDDFYYDREKIKSKVMNVFSLTPNVMGANECCVKMISSEEYVKFLNTNQLEYHENSSLRYGLAFNDELVFVMGFEKLNDDVWVLTGFCHKLFTSVTDGPEVILKIFKDSHRVNRLVSIVNRDSETVIERQRLGFRLESVTMPECRWIVNDLRQKEPNKIGSKYITSEHDVNTYHELGYVRTYDSGSFMFVKDLFND